MTKYEFTTDMFSANAEKWNDIRTHLKQNFGDNLHCIDVGSFEGQSAMYMSDNLIGDNGSLTIIDLGNKIKTLYKNILASNKSKQIVTFIGDSVEMLPKLLSDKEKYHFIYIDAGKNSCDNLTNLLIAERLLVVNGVVIVDDYNTEMRKWPKKEMRLNPKLGVDLFLQVTLLCEPYDLTGYQAIIIKTKDNKSIKVNNTI